MARWWQDEGFWKAIGPFLFPQSVWDFAAEDVTEVIELTEVEPGDRILDLGCGPGRYMLPLVSAGFDVLGVEQCAAFRRAARQRAQAQGHELTIRSLDVLAAVEAHASEAQQSGNAPDPCQLAVELELGSHDAVLDIFALVGYHDSPLVDAILVQVMLYLLNPGGWLMVQTRDPQLTTGTIKHADGKGGMCVEQRRYDRTSRLMSTQWTVHSRGRQRALQSRVRVYQQNDLRGLLEFAGFEEVVSWGSRSDERVTVIGRRPQTIE